MLIEKLFKLSLPPGGQETSLAPSMVSFASNAREFIDSVTGNSWFGPNQPQLPLAPKGTLPRAFDYPFGANLMMQPRTEQPGLVSFSQLRALSDNCDLLRIIIESRKKQIVKIPWVIRPRSDPPTNFSSRTDKPKRETSMSNIRLLTDFFERPDRQHDWTTWLSMLLEEVFVIDALSLWPMYEKSGRLTSLNIVDGATIKPLHDVQGWTPAPPNPGYQQFIKGMPSVNMTGYFCDDCKEAREAGQMPLKHRDGTDPCSPLVYSPRNPRVNKFYGFSNVEWVIRTILLALNRQTSQIAYYTEGNIPEMIVQAPAEWSNEDIKTFQEYFDTKAGDIAARRRMWFIPETKGILETKKEMLKDEMDEWLARVFCFAMGVSPQPFIRMMNRATAQVASESAAEEGTIPELEFVKGVLNYIVHHFFFIDDCEFAWKSDMESDGLKQMRIDTGYIRVGAVGVDEVRLDLGLHPIGVGNIIVTNKGAVPLHAEMLAAQVDALTPVQEPDKEGESNGSETAEGTE